MKLKLSKLFTLALLLTLTACLKTRAQLNKEEGSAPAETAPAKIEPVQTQNNYAVDELKSEVIQLTGRIEDLERTQKEQQTKSTEKDEVKKLQERITELENAQVTLIEALKKLEATRPAHDSIDAFEKGK